MNAQNNPLNHVMTANDVSVEFGKDKSAVRQYIKYHRDDMIEREVVRKSGGTWLILRIEAERIWGK